MEGLTSYSNSMADPQRPSAVSRSTPPKSWGASDARIALNSFRESAFEASDAPSWARRRRGCCRRRGAPKSECCRGPLAGGVSARAPISRRERSWGFVMSFLRLHTLIVCVVTSL